MITLDISSYKPSRLEQIVIDTYNELGITSPSEIDMRTLANHFGLRILELDVRSKMLGSTIVLDSRLSRQEQREDFFHEFTHALRHAGNQLVTHELLIELQESEANLMPYFWLVPTFMLADFDLSMPLPYLIPYLAEAFVVTESFMEKRLKLLKARLDMLAAEAEWAAVRESLPQYGRDYNMIRTIGTTEYFCKDGKVLYYIQRYE
jgi:Zn-dependent peptidase ImmA (M78 family)